MERSLAQATEQEWKELEKRLADAMIDAAAIPSQSKSETICIKLFVDFIFSIALFIRSVNCFIRNNITLK